MRLKSRPLFQSGVATLIALISLSPTTSSAQAEIFLDVPICSSNTGTAMSDDFAQVDITTNQGSVGVAVQAFESLDQSGFVELERTFTPLISLPATLTFGAVIFFGELTGFGGTGDIEGSVKVTVTLRDETAGIELAPPQVLLDESEDGGFLTQTTKLVDSGFNPPIATFPGIQLLTGNTYSVTARLEVRAKGLGARADFTIQPTQFGCLTATAELVDSDGDGLFDIWEQNGVDIDANGTIDVPLPAFGADPMHKDLFIEYDWITGFAPTRNDIQNVKTAFANAPVDAGGVANPDALPGINIWIDTGTATDPLASEDGVGLNTCGDGVDNGGDGFTDAADPDCLSGDDLGGGNAVAGGVNDLDASFYAVKNSANGFTEGRRGLFRYGIQGDPADAPAGLGGRAELGGDDFVVFNRLPGSLFHEIGHTLNLDHGGEPNDTNCKPNYVSVMNYHHQLGLRLNGATGGQDLDGDGTPDGRFLDFSPAQVPGGRAQAPLVTLDEADLDDGLVLDATDPVNQFAFVNPAGTLVRAPVNVPIDWDNDGDITEMGQQIDVDINGPSTCAANVGLTIIPPGLKGYDDWTNIRLSPLADGDLVDAALNPVLEPEPDEQALFDLERQFNSTDLRAEKIDAADPVEVGDPVTYTIDVANAGPNPASRTLVTDTLPDSVSFISASPECALTMADEVVCELGELMSNEMGQVQIQVDTDDVCENGLPPVLMNVVTVSNEPQFAGPDPDPTNNDATEATVIQDTTPPVITCNAQATISPPDAPISFTATAEDLCDDAPVVEVIAFDCFKFTKKGKKIDKTNSCVVTFAGDTVTIEDSGGVDDNIEWTVRATDASGNVAEEVCSTLVVNPGQGN